MQASRFRLFLIWLISPIIIISMTAMLTMLLSPTDYFAAPLPNQGFRTDFWGVVMFLPLGWILHLFMPTGWISAICLGLALYKRNRKPLYLAALCAVAFGFFWPALFEGMMGI